MPNATVQTSRVGKEDRVVRMHTDHHVRVVLHALVDDFDNRKKQIRDLVVVPSDSHGSINRVIGRHSHAAVKHLVCEDTSLSGQGLNNQRQHRASHGVYEWHNRDFGHTDNHLSHLFFTHIAWQLRITTPRNDVDRYRASSPRDTRTDHTPTPAAPLPSPSWCASPHHLLLRPLRPLRPSHHRHTHLTSPFPSTFRPPHAHHPSRATAPPPRPHPATPFPTNTPQTRSGVIGISICVTPKCASASTTAFAIAGGAPTVADSPTPFAPSG